MQVFWQDVRIGARMLRKQPGVNLLAVLAELYPAENKNRTSL